MNKSILTVFALVNTLMLVTTQSTGEPRLESSKFNQISCGVHPQEALASLSLKSEDKYTKICTLVVVKDNVAVGKNCHFDQNSLDNLFVSAPNGNYLKVVRQRDEKSSSFQLFEMASGQHLSKVCVNAKDMSDATELFTLKWNEKNLSEMTSQSFSLDPKIAKQNCQYDVKSNAIQARCSEFTTGLNQKESYGFAKINNEWNLVSHSSLSPAKSEEVFEIQNYFCRFIHLNSFPKWLKVTKTKLTFYF